MKTLRKALGIAVSAVAMALATAALAQHHGGGGQSGGSHSGGGNQGGWHGGSSGSGGQWHGGGSGGNWRGGSGGNWRGSGGGWHGGSGFVGPRYGYRSYGYYGYPYYWGWYGPSYYYDPYPYYYGYDYVAPPVVYYQQQAPQLAQASPPPPPAPAPAPRAAPPAPAPQATPAPRLFERITLSAHELFAFDRAELRMPQPKLDEIAFALNENPRIGNIHITGYTDRLGSDSYNLKLSQRRADAVKMYLVSKGVASNRLTAIGRGETNPLVQCHQRNRAELIQCLEPNRRVEVEEITVERPQH